MLRPKRIEELMKRGKIDENIAWLIFNFMYYLHQPYSEILKMPIPLVDKLNNCLEKQKKEEAKAFKK